jgi:hypothetical protein
MDMHTTIPKLRALTAKSLPVQMPALLVDHAGRIGRGLSLLAEARDYAGYLQRDIWDFAVELSSLQSAGMTNSEIRCLVCLGYVKHSRERVSSGTDGIRRFCEEGFLTLCSESCFVLTDDGAATLASWLPPQEAQQTLPGVDLPATKPKTLPPLAPTWDGERQELRVGGHLVKRFKLPSPNQEMILSSFQEENWPVRIDDPLPPVADILPKRRLHDTIKSLNRSQKCRLIRFLGDGSGEGVRWELRYSDSPTEMIP